MRASFNYHIAFWFILVHKFKLAVLAKRLIQNSRLIKRKVYIMAPYCICLRIRTLLAQLPHWHAQCISMLRILAKYPDRIPVICLLLRTLLASLSAKLPAEQSEQLTGHHAWSVFSFSVSLWRVKSVLLSSFFYLSNLQPQKIEFQHLLNSNPNLTMVPSRI